MFYLVPWLSLMIAGLIASVVLLIWGFRSGQFADQERARFLPLRDDKGPIPARPPGRAIAEVYALAALFCGLAAALAVTFVLAVMKRYGG